MQHPAVLHAAAIPVADVRLGEKVCIVVAARPGADIEADELLAHLDRSGLSRYDMPEYYLKLDRIPLTASGKVLKRALLSQVSEGAVVPRPIRFAPAAMA
jgi:acyl-CoA synthetase